jgi:arsenate reductase/ArsR family transcriptional regulator
MEKLFELESVFKAVGDSTRARIMKMLSAGEHCVCQIVAVLGLSQSTISKHLWILRSAGLIQDRKDGRWVYYSLAQKSSNKYAEFIISNISNWLEGDEMITADLKKVMALKRVPVEKTSELGSRVFNEYLNEELKKKNGE